MCEEGISKVENMSNSGLMIVVVNSLGRKPIKNTLGSITQAYPHSINWFAIEINPPLLLSKKVITRFGIPMSNLSRSCHSLEV